MHVVLHLPAFSCVAVHVVGCVVLHLPDRSSRLRLKRDVVTFSGAVRSSPRGVKGAVLPTAARILRRISGFCQNTLLVF